MKYALVFLLGVIVSFAVFLANYLGAFKAVTILEDTRGPYTMIYKDFVGPYHKTVGVITEVESWAQEHGLACRLSFGEYLDNPETTEEARLKSHGGCLVETPTEKIPEEMPKDFKTQVIPAQKYVVAIFSGSPGIGPMKVYPKVAKYMESQKLKEKDHVIELYEIHSRTERDDMTTTYLFPVVDPAASAAPAPPQGQ